VHQEGKTLNTIPLHEKRWTGKVSEIVSLKQNDAQAQGSGITYARRYYLQSFVCVGADDDDGNKASAPLKFLRLQRPNLTKLWLPILKEC
jgi:hypothetical protein